MIRGRKNYLPPAVLTYGFGFMFKLEDSSIDRHKGERAPKIEQEIQQSLVLVCPLLSSIFIGAAPEEEADVPTSEQDQVQRSDLELFLDASLDRLPSTVGMGESLTPSISQISDIAETSTHGRQTQETKAQSPTKTQEKLHKAQQKECAKEEERPPQQRVAQLNKQGKSKESRRGKKKGKHGERDEEDLRLMAELLQSAGSKKTKQQR